MPTHCCVPECTKKGYREEDGTKVSFFKFPIENAMKKKWLHAIRREEGKYFKVTKSTRVCSRHFREGDIKKTLSGKNELTGLKITDNRSPVTMTGQIYFSPDKPQFWPVK